MESTDFQQRSVLATTLQEHLSKMEGTQATKAKALGITQPRLSDLMRNRLDKFSLDALVSLTERSGLRLDMIPQDVSLPPTQGTRFANRKTRDNSPFPVEPSELARLDSIEASKLFLRLLRCDVYSVGLTPKDAVLSLRTTTKDCGIDAKVEKSPEAGGLLAIGDTHFQIKTGTSFKPWQPSALKKELFGKTKAKPSRKLLGEAIRHCLDNDGTYSLVTFGYDLLPHQHTAAIKALTSLFKEVGLTNPKVEVLGQGQIAGEIERYPSIYRDLFGFANDSLFTVRTWRNQSLMQQPLITGTKQNELISKVRNILTENSSSFIRIVGEPGIGKTRLVLEALSDENIAPTVVYVPTGEEFQESRLFKELIQSEKQYYQTIVVDDCDDRDRASVLAAFKNKPSIKVVTIDHGPAHADDSEVRTFQCPRLDNDQINGILETYLGKRQDLGNWAEICEGSPRVAHAVGQNLKENPEDILRQPSSVPVWDRFVIGYEDSRSRAAEEFRVVLRHIALFTKFGFESPVSEEGRFIAQLVQQADPLITYAKFQEIVRHFRGRRILQGSHTLFLVPRALQIHLWLDYWTNYGRGFDFQKFLSEVPPSMRDWFLRLFTYAHKPEPARAVVRSILDPDGPFADQELLNSEVGPRLLRYLAEADPEGTISCIERTYGDWDLPALRSWTTGRPDIVRALEYIAVWEHCFERATRVLIKLALTENSDYSNNSTGTLKGLFSIGLGWAATKAPPEARFEVFRRLIESRDEAQFRLAIELAEEWLSTYGGHRVIGPEYQGLRPTIEFWMPQTYGEVFDAWRKVWDLISSELTGSDTKRKNSLAHVLISSAEGLIQIDALAPKVIATMFDLANDPEVEKKSIVAAVIRLLKYRADGLSESTISQIRELDDVLTGHTLWDRVSRYVLYTNWDEDVSIDGDTVADSELPSKRSATIAQELMASVEVFSNYVRRLLVSSGHRLPALGYECGRLADDSEYDQTLLAPILEADPGLNAEFLGGYLGGLRSIAEERWEMILTKLLDNADTRPYGLWGVASSGFSESILDKLIRLYSDGKIEANAFDRFALRLPSSKIAEPNFLALTDALLNRPTPDSSSVVVELIQEYYLARDNAPALPRPRSLTALISATGEEQSKNPMRSHYWGRLAKAHIEAFPDDQLNLLDAILSSKKLRHYNSSEAMKVANQIVRSDPNGAWGIISHLLEDRDLRRYDLLHWLGNTFGNAQKDNAPVCFLPPEPIIEWTKVDPDFRVGRVLQILPKTLDAEKGGLLTSRFIEEFGQEENVSGGLVGHFWAGSWSGPESMKLENDRDNARKWLATATSQPVRSWLSYFISSMTNSIRDAKIREEREF